MTCYQPKISRQRREAIRQAARAVVRLQIDPQARKDAHRHNVVVKEFELYTDQEARDAVQALAGMVEARGLTTAEGDPHDYPCDECGAQPGEPCMPWCIARNGETSAAVPS